MSVAAVHPKGKGCWYFTTIYECAICARSETFRERRWSEKPDDPRERSEWIQTACSEHFL